MQRQDDSRITEQAAEWLEAVEEGGPAKRAAFAAWLKESPRHVGEVLTVAALCKEFKGMDFSNVLVENAGAADLKKIVRLRKEVAAPRRRSVRRRSLGAAAAALASLAVAAAWMLFGQGGLRNYATDIGEQRGFELVDGSLVQLNTRSRVKVRFSEAARDIELIAGEALFDVAHNPQRPFRVHAGPAVIQAVGTQFTVFHHAQGVTVTVIEGSVRVQDRQTLRSGEKVSITPDGQITRVTAVDLARAVAWKDRRLVFVEDRLSDIVAEFNRYNQTPQMRVEGALLGEKRLTGVFDANAPESFVRFLDTAKDIHVERDAKEVVIRPR